MATKNLLTGLGCLALVFGCGNSDDGRNGAGGTDGAEGGINPTADGGEDNGGDADADGDAGGDADAGDDDDDDDDDDNGDDGGGLPKFDVGTMPDVNQDTTCTPGGGGGKMGGGGGEADYS